MAFRILRRLAGIIAPGCVVIHVLMPGIYSQTVSPQPLIGNETYTSRALSGTDLTRIDPINYEEIYSIPVSDISIIKPDEHVSGIAIDRNGDIYCLLRLTIFENRTNVPYCRVIKIPASNQGEIEVILKNTRGTLILQGQHDGKINIYDRLEKISYVYDPDRRRITQQRIPLRDYQLHKLSLELVSLWPTDKTSPEDSRGVSIRIQSFNQIGNQKIAVGRISGRLSESAVVVLISASGAINQIASNPAQTNIMVNDVNFPVPSASGRMPIRIPFYPVVSATIWGNDRLVLSSGIDDELHVYDFLGNHLERIVIGLPPPAVTEEDRSNYNNEYLSRPIDEELNNTQRALLQYRYESLPLPTNKPYWRQIIGDDSGLLWLRMVTRDGNVLTLKENNRDTYVVLDPEGEMIFQTTVPPGLQFSERQELANPIAVSANLLGRVEWDESKETHLIKVYEMKPVDTHLKDYLEQLWKVNH